MGQIRDRMAAHLELWRLSPGTRREYLRYAQKFVVFDNRTPRELGVEGIRGAARHPRWRGSARV